MAAAVSDAPTASQSLHQFVSASPWSWGQPRDALTRWTERRAVVLAWNLAPVVTPKRGEYSVGVHRRFDAAAGRVINCQVGVGLLLSTCCGDIPVDWRLQLPESWCNDPLLRRRARIPDSGDARPLWALGLELVGAQTERSGGKPLPVVADTREFGDTASLVGGLIAARATFVVSVAGTLAVHAGPHRAQWSQTRAVVPAEQLCIDDRLSQRGTQALVRTPRGRHRTTTVLWTLSGPVRLPGNRHTLRLIAKWHPRGTRPARVWLTDRVDEGIDELTALAGTQARTDSTVRALREGFGLLDFEGRSFPGWHHHMTLVSAAYGWHRLSGVPSHPHATAPAPAEDARRAVPAEGRPASRQVPGTEGARWAVSVTAESWTGGNG